MTFLDTNVPILGGVITLSKLKNVSHAIQSEYRKDLSLRIEIVENMRQATQNQMAVYVSAWKYSPLIDPLYEGILNQIIENELLVLLSSPIFTFSISIPFYYSIK